MMMLMIGGSSEPREVAGSTWSLTEAIASTQEWVIVSVTSLYRSWFVWFLVASWCCLFMLFYYFCEFVGCLH